MKPHYDRERRRLMLGRRIVKDFQTPAPNQVLVLLAFQEQGWPRRIDDPLPPTPEAVTKKRLHDAVRCLNRNQKQKLIRFHGDGTGQGVWWELVE